MRYSIDCRARIYPTITTHDGETVSHYSAEESAIYTVNHKMGRTNRFTRRGLSLTLLFDEQLERAFQAQLEDERF